MFRLPSTFGLVARTGTGRGRARMVDGRCRVGRRVFGYGLVDGEGETVLLVHGWGLAHSSYRPTAEALAREGFRVVVLDLPGFGASSDLAPAGVSLRRYAEAVACFLEGCDDVTDDTVHLVGHSFGGAVAAQLAHDRPDLVRSVVLVSSVSGATWTRSEASERLLADRPVWDWGAHLVHEFPIGRFPLAALEVLRDLSHNLLWHVPSMGLVAAMIRQSDLRGELSKIAEAGVPVAVVRANRDQVVTKACFDDQCVALGVEGTVVEGNHGWPLVEPDSFGRTIGGIIRTMSERISERP